MTYSVDVVLAALDLLDSGRSQKSVAADLGISRAAVRDWSSRPREQVLSSREPKMRDAGACDRIGASPPDAYAYLLGQYLGDGCISKMPKGVFRLRVSCCDAYPDIKERVADAMWRVLPNKVGRIQCEGCTEMCSDSKHWPCLFPQHGPGKKHTRLIALEPWQLQIVGAHTRQFVRGLIESDGCRVTNRVAKQVNGARKTYAYPRYFFSNTSRDILEICGDALDLLGVAWRYNRPNSISIAKRDAVAKLDEFIGPKS